jgi:hypothetical protein
MELVIKRCLKSLHLSSQAHPTFKIEQPHTLIRSYQQRLRQPPKNSFLGRLLELENERIICHKIDLSTNSPTIVKLSSFCKLFRHCSCGKQTEA